MNEQAVTLLQQGRSFVRAGDPVRAAELLRRARLLAGGDEELQIAILRELTQISGPAGLNDEAAVWSEQLAALEARHTSAQRTTEPGSPQAVAPRVWLGRRMRWWYAGVAGTAVVIATIVLLSRTTTLTPKRAQPKVPTSDSPPSGVEPAAPVRAQADRTGSADTGAERQRQLYDGIGLLFWVQHYEGTEGGQNISLDYVMASGSAFAVHKSGLMLTNRHVTAARTEVQPPDSSPPTLLRVGKPTLTVCFGPDASRHYSAEVLHESPTYDLAIIRVPRRFDRVFQLAWDRQAAMGDAVVAAGFPGVVLSISQAADPTFAQGRLLELVRTGRLTYRDQYPPDAFTPVATRGIISSPNRSIEGAIYHLFDARVAPGNSGGPLLLEGTNQVIGIVTISGVNAATGYNYALTLPQLREEIMRYLP